MTERGDPSLAQDDRTGSLSSLLVILSAAKRLRRISPLCIVKEDMKRPYRKRRKYRTRQDRRLLLLLAVLLGAALLLFGLIKLIGYGRDWLAARNTSRELQTVYHDAPTDAPAFFTEEPTAAPTPSPAPRETVTPTQTPDPSPSPVPRLEAMNYPNNPKLQISSRFKALRWESKYIMGWLNMGTLLDEPVVQRDDTFYLTHDAKGQENVNGAIFLDASIGIKTRPYSYILYGHNMKTGAMFGSLRNYENRNFYHTNPFITFDTMYEDGRYVIFAIGSVSTEEYGRHYVDFHDLKSTDREKRQKAIDALISASVFTCPLDVRAEDQILLLVTCTEKDQDRRVVAARRVRDGEDETELKRIVERSRKR